MTHLIKLGEVRQWCISRGFHPSRVLGQNFLVDGNILAAIRAAAQPLEGRRVLEIGPGLGAVTVALLQDGAAVTAIEKDERMAAWLREMLDGRSDFALFEADALDLDVGGLLRTGRVVARRTGEPSEDAEAEPGTPWFDACVSNLPYSVGTRILLDLCRHSLAPERLLVTVQREVAERLAAPPGDGARGLAGVWAQRQHDVERLRTVPPGCFWPRPEVDSCLVLLRRHDRRPLDAAARARFETLTRHAFAHRRKQMLAVLRTAPPELTPSGSDPEALLRRVGITPALRPEKLENRQWHALTLALAAPIVKG